MSEITAHRRDRRVDDQTEMVVCCLPLAFLEESAEEKHPCITTTLRVRGLQNIWTRQFLNKILWTDWNITHLLQLGKVCLVKNRHRFHENTCLVSMEENQLGFSGCDLKDFCMEERAKIP